MTETTLIKNARMVNEGSVKNGDLLIRNGRIEKIASSLSAEGTGQVVDAGGAWLLPGMIDFANPG